MVQISTYLYELIATSALLLKSVESDFAVDSSGFSSGQFMRWLGVKCGKEEDRHRYGHKPISDLTNAYPLAM